MERVLITGVDGVVGGNLAASLADCCQVIGTWQNEPVDLPGCRIEDCDECDPDELAALLKQTNPRWIVHCGQLAVSSWTAGQASAIDPSEVTLVERLAATAGEINAPLTVIGSDDVFAGPGLFHEESALRCGGGARAALAREIEDLLSRGSSLIVRTNAYGFSPTESRTDFSEQAWLALTQGEQLSTEAEPHATPILATDLAPLLWRAHQRRLQGVLHLCGAERTSPARFMSELAMACSPSGTAIGQTAEAAKQLLPARETSLDTRLARRELSANLPLLREGLARFAEQAANGWRAQLQGHGNQCSQAA
ncbi:MAG: sugar nucleotide-binding protein [Pirellulales bacterium]